MTDTPFRSHDGKLRPVGADALVIVRFRHQVGKRNVESGIVPAGNLQWAWAKVRNRASQGGDILSYRLATEAEVAAKWPACRDSDGSPKGEDALAASSETTARAEGIAQPDPDHVTE